MAVSVCMATYRGERYVETQLRSILDQLASGDEVIVVDDCSTDATVEAIQRINDSRIALHVNDRNRREVYSFNRAIMLAKHDILFLADQDDIWLPGRAEQMAKSLRDTNAALVSTNFEWMDHEEQHLKVSFDGVRACDSERRLKNILEIFLGKTNYFGCAMAFQRKLVPLIIPIPDYVESHDLWIALAANLIASNLHLDEATLRKRRHSSNATSTVSNRSLFLKLRARAIFVRSLLDLRARQRRLAADCPSKP